MLSHHGAKRIDLEKARGELGWNAEYETIDPGELRLVDRRFPMAHALA